MILEIGGIACRLETRNHKWRSFLKEKYKTFLINDKSEIKLYFSIVPQKKDKFLINFSSNFSKVEILTPSSLGEFSLFNLYFKVATAAFLLNNGGFLLHASTLLKDKKGLVFAGKRGSGKSTIIQLAKGRYQPLNDDFAIIRKIGRRFYVFSSPFYETNPVPKVRIKAPIKSVFFLEQSKSNSIKNISKEDSMVKLASLILSPLKLPHLSAERSRDFALKIWKAADDFVRMNSLYLLYFKKDKSLLDLIK